MLTRYRSAVPTWDEIIPYCANSDELSAVVEQGDGLTFSTLEGVERKDHPMIPTTWVKYDFKTEPGDFPSWWYNDLHGGQH